MKLSRFMRVAMVVLTSLAGSISFANAQGSGSPTIDTVVQRGQLLCGVAGNIPGFALPDSQGVMKGIDADYCRAFAAAVLGDANKLRFILTPGAARFPSVQTGVTDVSSQQTTWTLSREASLGLLFPGIYMYDGGTFMVKTSSGIKAAKELDGATVCVQSGTTTELIVADYFRNQNMKFNPVLIENIDAVNAAFLAGRCDVRAGDASAQAAFRANQGPKASELVILPELISKEPLGPFVRKGDDKWFDLIRWIMNAMVIAEENGVTSQNIDTFANTTNPDIKRLLGMEGDIGKMLGVDNKFAYNVIKQVGNYGEVWERNISPLAIPRGLNNLWSKGGLIYAPPAR